MNTPLSSLSRFGLFTVFLFQTVLPRYLCRRSVKMVFHKFLETFTLEQYFYIIEPRKLAILC